MNSTILTKHLQGKQKITQLLATDIDQISTMLPITPASKSTRGTFSMSPITPEKPGSSFSTERFDQDLIIYVWASLLRRYLQNDVIHFALITSGSDENDDHTKCNSETVSARWLKDNIAHIGDQYTYKRQCDSEISKELMAETNTCIQIDSLDPFTHTGFDFVLHVSFQAQELRPRLFTCNELIHPTFGQAVAAALFSSLEKARFGVRRPALDDPYNSVDTMFIKSTLPNRLPDLDGTLVDMFEAGLVSSSSESAVCAWDGSLTYHELQSRSDAAAIFLVSEGVQKGQRIPLYFEKSVWVSVAILAIAKAGGVIVPLGLSQPMARIQSILSRVDAKFLVTSTNQVMKLGHLGVKTYAIDELRPKPREHPEPDTVQMPTVDCHDNACVLFTSGSTGTPKGMVLRHGSVFTHITSFAGALGCRSPRLFQFSAHTWDVFIIDLFTAWFLGGCVCVPNEDDCLTNPTRAASRLDIDTAILTPTIAGILEPDVLPQLKHLVVGGEAMNSETVSRWSNASGVVMTQMYGPAETGICIMGGQAANGGRLCTVGTSLQNSICILVDTLDPTRLALVGAKGELVVGGPSIATNYLDDRERTQDAFIEDPPWVRHLGLPVTRFYRTGDHLRYNTDQMDGSFDFVGRADFQVKYHGQRIELGDIESHLDAMSSVARCLVDLPSKGIYSGKLVAIAEELPASPSSSSPEHDGLDSLQVAQEGSLSLDEIQKHLRGLLPSYMIPNALILVAKMPTTDSKKLDRKAVQHWVASLHQAADSPGQMASGTKLTRLRAEEKTAWSLSEIYAKLVHPNHEAMQRRLAQHDFRLRDCGMDSVRVILFSQAIEKRYARRVTQSVLGSSKCTVRALARLIDNEETSLADEPSSFIRSAWDKAMTLDNVAFKRDCSSQKETKVKLFLTGSTGYLGLEILRQLLMRKDIKVCALVRDKSDLCAQQRVAVLAQEMGWWNEEVASRLEVWHGDLSQPRLGLSDLHYNQLSGHSTSRTANISLIIHNGARVHYASTYEDLEDANVTSTVELLRAARCNNSIARFVYVSGGQIDLSMSQDEALHANTSSKSGYNVSKLVSEALIRISADQSDLYPCSFTTLKPGFIIGSERDPTVRSDDYIWRLVSACVAIGEVNANEEHNYVFVASRQHVATAVVESSLSRVYESVKLVSDGMLLSSFWSIIEEQTRAPLKRVEKGLWLSHIRSDIAKRQGTHPLFTLTEMVEEGSLEIGVPLDHNVRACKALRSSICYL